MNIRDAMLVRLEATAQVPAADGAKLPEGPPEVALAETGTITRNALRMHDNTFSVLDAFAGEEGRRARLAGEIPVAIGKVASALLSTKPLIERVTIVAVK